MIRCHWVWEALRVAVHRRPASIRHGHRVLRRRLLRRPGIWRWTCAAGPPLLAIPPLAYVWHPAAPPLPPVLPPPDLGGYDTFWPGFGGGFLPSGVGQLIPAAFVGSPSLLNVPPSLTGTACCGGGESHDMSTTEPGAALLLGAALVVTALLGRARKVAPRPALSAN